MSILRAIQNRKSCRAYSNQEVDQKTIQDILEAAKWAPSGVNHQPTKVAVLGNETKSKLSKLLIEKHRSGVINSN
jgi:nitroreductase